MKISVIGTGYVGSVCGACLAKKGHEVICMDNQPEVVNSINNAEAALYEPYLSEYIGESLAAGRLFATTDLEAAVNGSDVSIITVDTPLKKGSIDLGRIVKVSEDIGRILKSKKAYHVICVKSTVIPATTDTLVKGIIEEESKKKAGEFGLVMNPEFLREGEAVMDFMYPDRIVIGAYDDKSFESFNKVYEGYFDAQMLKVSLRTAELIKYASNSLLAMLISYSNEIAAISEASGKLDAEEVLYGVSLDKRLSPKINGSIIRPGIINYLKAGRGYGGSCFPKDVKSLIAFSGNKGYTPWLLKAVADINERQAERIEHRLEGELGIIEGRKVLIMGLAFKKNSDDIRESQSIKLVKLLAGKKALVGVTDPMAMKKAVKELEGVLNVSFISDYKSKAASYDAIVLMTPWEDYIDFFEKGEFEPLNTTILFDGCRALRKDRASGPKLKYLGVGLS